jgi:hypothetical protein
MSDHLANYLKYLRDNGQYEVADAVEQTTSEVIPEHIGTFSFRDHITGLLLGNVQSGKTGQMFGIIAGAANAGFDIFVLLTTDITSLQEQTLTRAMDAFLAGFEVCGENDFLRFQQNRMRRPIIIVLKKNSRVLDTWKNNLASSGFLEGKSIFIIDDEGDAASLNTQVNKDQISTINRHLLAMRELASGSIYLQVTGTPQAILLQAEDSNFKPSFVYYFPPGKSYLGGDFFYTTPKSFAVVETPDDELDILQNSNGLSEGLEKALLTFLVTAVHSFEDTSAKVCNFLVHPSVKIYDHQSIHQKVVRYLKELEEKLSDSKILEKLQNVWQNLQQTKPQLLPLDIILELIPRYLEQTNALVMNSASSDDIAVSKGINIIVGGNSLGRGFTFPALQTVYYCRSAKQPQADTFWQHCRMFGYDRDPGLMRVFLPSKSLDLFTELNRTNSALIKQIQTHSIDEITLLYPPGIQPTRKNVVDQNLLNVISGGVSYFPSEPQDTNTGKLDELLKDYQQQAGEYIEVDSNLLEEILSLTENLDPEHFSLDGFLNAIKALALKRPQHTKGLLVVRRGRKISKGTGTLLSPDDRRLGEKFSHKTVLTLYRVDASPDRGWYGNDLWIPNINLPSDVVFYKLEEET